MTEDVVRVWKRMCFEEISKHLLNVGDSLGNCESCKELGLAYATVTHCPSCGTEFKYVTSRNASGTGDGRFHVVKQFLKKRQDLVYIDYDDYKKIAGRDQAKKFFND
jgi:hypothetical protein